MHDDGIIASTKMYRALGRECLRDHVYAIDVDEHFKC